MKKTLLLAAAALMSMAAIAQETFSREMPCKNNFGQVIATKMGTICLPYAATPVDCKTYKLVSASADEWVFQEVLKMDANTPYVFVVENNTTLEANFKQEGEAVACETPVAEAAGVPGAFVGSYKEKVIRNKKMYFLSFDKVNYNDGQPIVASPYRAYFDASVMPAGQQLSENVKLTFLQATTTRINQVADEAAAEVTVARQNIGLQQGKYNINGKKVVVK